MTAVHHQVTRQHPRSEPRAHQLVKAATAVTAGGSLLVLSGLTLTATVIALTVATPVLVIFSPVIVPAVIAAFVLAGGFLASGGFGVAAATVLGWMYRYVRSSGDEGGKQRGGDESLTGGMQGSNLKSGHHATGGVHLTTGARAGLYRG